MMTAYPVPDNESARLSDLFSFDVLDTPPEKDFDRLTRLACSTLNVPMALVSLIEIDRQWFKSTCGISAVSTPRSLAFCAHAIMRDEVMVVPDARLDPRFRHHPYVVGDPNIRFYAGAPLRTSRGHNIGTLCVVDSSPRKLHHTDISSLREIADTVMDLLEVRLAARQAAQRAKSVFLTGMSHELRTPLSGIMGFAEMLNIGGLSPDEQREAADAILRNSTQLLSVIESVLEHASLEAGAEPLALTSTPLATFLAEVRAEASRKAEAKGLAFSMKWEGDQPATVAIDAVRLRRVLSNLIDNAVKFTPTGSVSVIGKIVDAPAAGPSLSFDVTDTGIGFPPEHAQRLFQPFARVDESMSRAYGGVGLGLTIARALAQRMGGEITASSEPGKGSTFTVRVGAGNDSKQARRAA